MIAIIMNAITIHIATQENLHDLRTIADGMKSAKMLDYFEIGLERQQLGKGHTLILCYQEDLAGYCLLNWEPKYGFYKKLGIPEIQDLNILPAFRKKGLGTTLIKHCEQLAVDKGLTQMGISFGLDSSYGAAQRLYVKLGYIPDGNGITYDRAFVNAGDFRPVDDDLCLMMVKDLG